VLAVVDQQQTVQLARPVAEAVTHGARRLRADAECPCQRVGDQVGGGNGGEVGQARLVGKPLGDRCCHMQRKTGLPRASRAGQREQPMALEQRGDLVRLALAANEAGQRDGQGGADLRRPADLRAHLDQGRPVGDAELPQQGADVAFDRPHGDVQALGDLAVVQALGDGRQDLGFAFGDAGPGQPLWRAAVEAGHGGILPVRDERWTPAPERLFHRHHPDGVRADIRAMHGCAGASAPQDCDEVNGPPPDRRRQA